MNGQTRYPSLNHRIRSPSSRHSQFLYQKSYSKRCIYLYIFVYICAKCYILLNGNLFNKSQSINVKLQFINFLGGFAKLRKATISFVMSVSPSVRPPPWNNSAPTGPIFMKIDIWVHFGSMSKKIQVSLTSDTHNGYFT
jgi:hypothetical protein